MTNTILKRVLSFLGIKFHLTIGFTALQEALQRERMPHMADDLSKLIEEVQNLAKGISGLSNRLATVETNTSGLDSRLSNLETGIQGLDGRLANVEANTNGTDARLANIEGNMATSTQVERLDKNVATMEKRLKKRMGEHKSELKQDISSLAESTPTIREFDKLKDRVDRYLRN